MASSPDSIFALAAPGPQSQAVPPHGALQQLGRALQTGDLSAAQQAYGLIQRSAASATPARRTDWTGSWKDAIAELEPALRKDALSAVQLAVTPGPTSRAPAQMAQVGYAAQQPAAQGTPARDGLGTQLNVSL